VLVKQLAKELRLTKKSFVYNIKHFKYVVHEND
jgi:hypothetical protein